MSEQNHQIVDKASERERRSHGSEWSHGSDEEMRKSLGSPSNESDRSHRSTDSGNIRNMTNRNRPNGKVNDEATVPTILNSDPPEDIEEGSVPQVKIHKQPTVGCSAKNLIGGIICGAMVIGWVIFLFTQDGGANLFKNESATNTPSTTSWNTTNQTTISPTPWNETNQTTTTTSPTAGLSASPSNAPVAVPSRTPTLVPSSSPSIMMNFTGNVTQPTASPGVAPNNNNSTQSPTTGNTTR